MPKLNLNLFSPLCLHCDFSPFCLHKGKSSHYFNQGGRLILRQQRLLKRKEVLCISKNKFQNLYAIQKGALKTYQAEANGKELIRGFYFAGDILGYEAIYYGQYLTSAVALSETLVCEIPYNHFLNLLRSDPDLQKHILQLISKQLSVGAYLAATVAEQRLAAFLVDLSTRLHKPGSDLEFMLPMSRQEIGNYLNLTAETISRIFSRLQQNKIIRVKNRKIHLLEIEKLKKIAEGIANELS